MDRISCDGEQIVNGSRLIQHLENSAIGIIRSSIFAELHLSECCHMILWGDRTLLEGDLLGTQHWVSLHYAHTNLRTRD